METEQSFGQDLNRYRQKRPKVDASRGRHPEPTGTHFDPIRLEPGTHWNPLFMVRLGTRNPLEPKYGGFSWVPPGTLEPGTTEPIIFQSVSRETSF